MGAPALAACDRGKWAHTQTGIEVTFISYELSLLADQNYNPVPQFPSKLNERSMVVTCMAACQVEPRLFFIFFIYVLKIIKF